MRQSNEISVSIIRMGGNAVDVTVPEDSTLADALASASIELTPSETAWVNGVEASSSDIMDDGDTIQLVGKKDGGLK